MDVRGLDHVGIHVADVAVSEAFYRSVIGLAQLPRPDLGFPGGWLRIGATQELHLIGKNSCPDVPPTERHFALQVADVDACAARLRVCGVPFDGPRPRADGARQIFLRDPDGHVIELLELAPAKTTQLLS